MKIIHPFSEPSNKKFIISTSYNYYINDDKDKSYLDGISGLYNCPLGYSVQSIKDKISQALFHLPTSHIFSSTINEKQSNVYVNELTSSLFNIIPFGKSIFFANSGSEAIDGAINICKQNSESNKKVILSFTSSYHGSTINGLSISGNLSEESKLNQFIDFYYFYDNRTPKEYISYVESRIIETGPENILAFIVEPMIGSSGGFFMKENILPELKKLLNKHSIYFILDEVITGFGRLGTIFAWEKYNVIPDLLILSKAITNGYMPLSCVITSFEHNIMSKFGYTTSGHPVSCAAATESIKLILESQKNINGLEKYIKFKIENIKDKFYKIEQEGLFIALHFSNSDNFYSPNLSINSGGILAAKIKENGVILRGNPKSLILCPGYNMEYDQIDIIFDAIQNEC